jgi:CheY-like chemotaxis protein
VLVVDDNAANRRMLVGALARWGMGPEPVERTEAALEALDRAQTSGQPFALVLADAYMPGLDGFALAEDIRRHPQLVGTSLVMMVSAGQRGDAARCRELKVAAYLPKPIRQAELREALGMVLAAKERSLPQPPLVTRHSLREGRPTAPKQRVLVVEDNPVNQRLAVRLLSNRGYQVALAGNGLEALAALEKEPFDAVLMDMQMPEMDGFEATAAIRKREQKHGGHLPVIALTAHAMVGDRERCLAAGADGYVPKPISATQLFETLDELVPASSECSPA